MAGRTDAGVHAEAQVASFATARELDPHRLILALNALLPDEIAVTAIALAAAGFDARAAAARTYRYRLWLPTPRPVFERRYVWDVRGALDAELLRAAAAQLVGRRDFSALTPSARFYRTCEREVTRARGASRPAAARRDSRSPPTASCTTWCVSRWARWSTWPSDT